MSPGTPTTPERTPRSGPVVLTCEHASHLTPPGLVVAPLHVLTSHRGFDAGAHDVARRLAHDLHSPLIAARWSRLVIDCNRSVDSPELIPETSWGEPIPGNQGLSKADRKHRIAWVWSPFRKASQAAVRRAQSTSGWCMHLSIHSFSAGLGSGRDFDVGVLYDPSRAREELVATRLAEDLAHAGFEARRNQPYLGVDDGHTTALRHEFPDPTYAGVEIEMNAQRFASAIRRNELEAALSASIQRICSHRG